MAEAGSDTSSVIEDKQELDKQKKLLKNVFLMYFEISLYIHNSKYRNTQDVLLYCNQPLKSYIDSKA